MSPEKTIMRNPISLKILSLVFLTFLFYSCRIHYDISENKTIAGVVALDSTMTEKPDSIALAIIAPYKNAMETEMEEVLAYSERPLTKDLPEGLLNNFIADLVLNMANIYYNQQGQKIDFCLMNNGGLRSSLPKGELRTRNIFELMPFENKITIMTITGHKTSDLFNYVAQEGGMPVSGIQMGIKDDKAVNIFIQSVAIDTTRNYTLATVDYLADGGDKMSFFKDPVQRTDLQQKVRDAIIEYLRKLTEEGKTVDSKLDKRVYYEK